MYQALYRKYRPKKFDDVVGQDVIIHTLKNAIKINKVSHAYLFTGPRGTGKTSIAKILAKTVNCSNLNDFIPCEQCINCIHYNNKQTTDIIEIDAASNNGVDEIREIKSKVNLIPSNGKYKIYIIDEVHMLTVGAFNALLKTLEEPPNHIIFILATTEPHKIPTTILSRCQRFDFKRVNLDSIIKRLKFIVEQEQIDVDDDALMEIARLSHGGMRDSISMLDQVVSYTNSKIASSDVHEINGTLTQKDLSEFVEKITENDISSILEKIEIYDSMGKDFLKLSEELILFFKNILLYLKAPNYIKEHVFNWEIYENNFMLFSQEILISYIEILNKATFDMKNSNDSRLIFELAIIEILQKKELLNISGKQENNFLIDKLENDSSLNKTDFVQESVEKKCTVKVNSDDEKNIKIVDKQSNVLENDKLLQKKNQRIENTLACFNKKILIEIRQKIEQIHTLILNPDYSKYAAMILDGQLKAASDEYLIFVYPNDRMSLLFNQNILAIEKTLDYFLKKNFRVIALHQTEWDPIKNEFNSHSRKYHYVKEVMTDNENQMENVKIEHNCKNIMDELFGNMIEYK